ncbi:hypothetical protein BLNAU_16325 [Blattamonas nauphoetae]|uniref:Lipid/polyisoprenoid-binding YceI-like domain-containing protein n=1 Tax=Blattamonas nauphoetae TaxID=2049346 RepID=A0ABQ9XDF0_9EUKA|nr:hypothetical protein BLNAU_16325 [Blattamonas nauphoetae]
MFLFIIGPAFLCASDYYLVTDAKSTVEYAADVTLHVSNYAELNGEIHIGPFAGTMNLDFLGESNDGELE